jgi:hypothetical protein
MAKGVVVQCGDLVPGQRARTPSASRWSSGDERVAMGNVPRLSRCKIEARQRWHSKLVLQRHSKQRLGGAPATCPPGRNRVARGVQLQPPDRPRSR